MNRPGHRASAQGVVLLLFAVAIWLRSIDLWRPVDGRVREAWRECDIAAVARNFCAEGMNIFYPRIDWRGDGPGFAEMEFPALSYGIALLYKTFGFHEQLGRIIPFLFSIGTLWIFLLLAKKLLPPRASLLALAFFVMSPLAIRVSNSLQPESIMLFFLIAAVYAFIRWLEERSWKWYWLAAGITACALLAKLNSAHIGLLFGALLFMHQGVRSLRSWRVWVLALLAVLPAALWYLHAHHLWLTYHNSLGLSNEYHWIGWDFFTNPRFVAGILRIELLFVWMPLGWLVGAYAILRGRWRGTSVALLWMLSVLAYYVAACRTTSEDWAIYYHIASVPPVALLFGLGADSAFPKAWPRGTGGLILAGAVALLAVVARLVLGSAPSIPTAIAAAMIGGVAATVLAASTAKGAARGLRPLRRLGQLAVFFCVASSLIFCGFRIAKDLHPSHMQTVYECAREVKPYIPPGELIVASGGHKADEDGYPLAINAPYLFYWLGHKGFNIAIEEQSVAALESLASRGAHLFVAERDALAEKAGFEAEMRAHFPLVVENRALEVFALVVDASQVDLTIPSQNSTALIEETPR
ncbi:MAG: glycosyltransferase family 39 protein [Calditrichaeota bacterium]|nr:glycosyltransferase family 39 protein [Calditrichota bacterium]